MYVNTFQVTQLSVLKLPLSNQHSDQETEHYQHSEAPHAPHLSATITTTSPIPRVATTLISKYPD